jgi:hypothetical protein
MKAALTGIVVSPVAELGDAPLISSATLASTTTSPTPLGSASAATAASPSEHASAAATSGSALTSNAAAKTSTSASAAGLTDATDPSASSVARALLSLTAAGDDCAEPVLRWQSTCRDVEGPDDDDECCEWNDMHLRHEHMHDRVWWWWVGDRTGSWEQSSNDNDEYHFPAATSAPMARRLAELVARHHRKAGGCLDYRTLDKNTRQTTEALANIPPDWERDCTERDSISHAGQSATTATTNVSAASTVGVAIPPVATVAAATANSAAAAAVSSASNAASADAASTTAALAAAAAVSFASTAASADAASTTAARTVSVPDGKDQPGDSVHGAGSSEVVQLRKEVAFLRARLERDRDDQNCLELISDLRNRGESVFTSNVTVDPKSNLVTVNLQVREDLPLSLRERLIASACLRNAVNSGQDADTTGASSSATNNTASLTNSTASSSTSTASANPNLTEVAGAGPNGSTGPTDATGCMGRAGAKTVTGPSGPTGPTGIRAACDVDDAEVRGPLGLTGASRPDLSLKNARAAGTTGAGPLGSSGATRPTNHDNAAGTKEAEAPACGNEFAVNGERYTVHDNGGRPFVVVVERDKHRISIWRRVREEELSKRRSRRERKGRRPRPFKVSPIRFVDSRWHSSTCECEPSTYELMPEHIYAFRRVFPGKDPEEPDFLGNTVLFEADDGRWISVDSRVRELHMLQKGDDVVDYMSPVGNSDVPYPYIIGQTHTYLTIEHVAQPNHTRTNPDPYRQFYEARRRRPRRARRTSAPSGTADEKHSDTANISAAASVTNKGATTIDDFHTLSVVQEKDHYVATLKGADPEFEAAFVERMAPKHSVADAPAGKASTIPVDAGADAATTARPASDTRSDPISRVASGDHAHAVSASQNDGVAQTDVAAVKDEDGDSDYYEPLPVGYVRCCQSRVLVGRDVGLTWLGAYFSAWERTRIVRVQEPRPRRGHSAEPPGHSRRARRQKRRREFYVRENCAIAVPLRADPPEDDDNSPLAVRLRDADSDKDEQDGHSSFEAPESDSHGQRNADEQ